LKLNGIKNLITSYYGAKLHLPIKNNIDIQPYFESVISNHGIAHG